MSKVLPNIFALACLAWVFPKEVRAACLPDAIPEAQRRHLAAKDGTPYPVGVWIGEWASGYITDTQPSNRTFQFLQGRLRGKW